MLLTLCLSVLYESHNKQRLLPHTILADCFCIMEALSVHCAVQSESLYRTDALILKGIL